MRRIVAVVVSMVCVVGLVGCASSEPEPAETPLVPSSSPTPTPTPTPESAGPRDLSDPELGIVFTDFPRDTDEQTAAAVEAYMLFETAFWRALTTNEVPPGPWAVASDDAIAWIAGQVGPNKENGWNAAGTFSTSVDVVSEAADTMTLAVCTNWSEVIYENTDGSEMSAVDAGLDETSGTGLTMVDDPGTGWKVDAYELTGPC